MSVNVPGSSRVSVTPYTSARMNAVVQGSYKGIAPLYYEATHASEGTHIFNAELTSRFGNNGHGYGVAGLGELSSGLGDLTVTDINGRAIDGNTQTSPNQNGLAWTSLCNWVNEFGDCINPGNGDTVVLQSGLRIPITGVRSGSGTIQNSLSDISKSLGNMGLVPLIAIGALVGLFLSRR